MSSNTPINRNRTITIYDTDAERPASAATFPMGHAAFSIDTNQLRIADGTAVWPPPVGGGGGVAVPINEIPYGTGSNITSSPGLTFDPSGPALANILTLKDLADRVIIEAGGQVGGARFFTVRDGTVSSFPLFDCDINPGGPKRQIVIGNEAGHQLILINTLTADLSIRFGEPGAPHLQLDMTNRILKAVASSGDSVWEVGWDGGKPLTFLNKALATASNGGFHNEGQECFIQKVLKFGELPPGTGAKCYWSDNGPAGPNWYTGDNKVATE